MEDEIATCLFMNAKKAKIQNRKSRTFSRNSKGWQDLALLETSSETQT